MASRFVVALALALLAPAACSSFHENGNAERDGSADQGTDSSFVLPPHPDASVDGASPDAREIDARDVDAGRDAPPSSCLGSGPGRSGCGVAGAGGESCCASPTVEAGTFDRTYDPYGFDGGVTVGPDGAAIGEADPATVSSFRLDKYLVTVGRFRPFQGAVLPADGGVGWAPAIGSGKHSYLNQGHGLVATGGGNEPGWQVGDGSNLAPTDLNLECDSELTAAATWTQYPGDYEYLPMNCVNWYEAYAFCIWDGGFLPSDAEYGYAEAGGAEQREFPWGSAPPGTTNQYAIYGTIRQNGPAEQPVCYYPDDVFCVGVTGSVAPVGTPPLGAGRWGQVDLVGDMFEWTLDWYDQNGFINPWTDCAYLTPPGGGSPTADGRVIRGAGWDSGEYDLPAQNRIYDDPLARTSLLGFRCARPPL